MQNLWYVSAHYDWTGSTSADAKIEEILEKHGGEGCGSGTGCGVRDLQFKMPKAVTMDELKELQSEINDGLSIDVEMTFEEWSVDKNGDIEDEINFFSTSD